MPEATTASGRVGWDRGGYLRRLPVSFRTHAVERDADTLEIHQLTDEAGLQSAEWQTGAGAVRDAGLLPWVPGGTVCLETARELLEAAVRICVRNVGVGRLVVEGRVLSACPATRWHASRDRRQSTSGVQKDLGPAVDAVVELLVALGGGVE